MGVERTALTTNSSGATTTALTLSELCGEYSFFLMPFILTAMMQSFRLSEATAGQFVSLQLLGMTIGSVLVSLTLRAGRPLTFILALAAAVIIIANVVCALVHDPTLAAGARIVTGMGEGTAMAAATAAVCATSNAHRTFSVIGLAGAVFGIVTLVGTPYMQEHLGVTSVFWMLALLPLPVFLLLRFIPSPAESSPTKSGNAAGALLRGAPMLLAYLLFWSGGAGVWVYAVRIGAAQGLKPTEIGLFLSIAQLLSTPAPLAAGWLGPRIGMRNAIVLGCAGLAIAAAVFIFGGAAATYVGGAFLASTSILFSIPCFRSRMASLDPSGRTVALSVISYTVGFGLAPLFISLVVVEGRGYAAAGVFCVVCFIASAVLGAVQRDVTPAHSRA